MKTRLDQALVRQHKVRSRSQAESYIKLGEVQVNGAIVTKPGFLVSDADKLEVKIQTQYVSRAALKLESVAQTLRLEFANRVVLDVGSSTGGFTDYALRHGARRVIAVELGTDQLHPTLRGHAQIELHEQTDILSVKTLTATPDIVVADVSFISLREILPHVATLCSKQTQIVAMVKPQFEARESELKHRGVIKNDTVRRAILKDFEDWARLHFVIRDKADSAVSGTKGNQERFYLLQKA
jgi:23S rRNA (cytidine1920-2'-O)/16S rRNA (cytidine1409-2'-O)-methyltransferase